MNNKLFKRFLLLWSGELVSAIGSGLTSFGLGVYVFQQTGKASAMTLVTLLAFLPSLLLSAVAGVLADRYDRRLLMIIGDSLSATGLIFILICMLNGNAKLWQICVGVTISSVFSSLLEPAYKATVTDLLTKEQYAKASGLVQMAGSAKYLISPALAGVLLSIADIKLLLIIDICTFFVTVTATLVVRRGIETKLEERTTTFIEEFKDGWKAIKAKKGVLVLTIAGSALTLFIGYIQILSTPMILAFASSTVLGTAETICACGMLATSILIGVCSIKHSYTKVLSISLILTGVFMIGFGFTENIVIICITGFLFFATLPYANTCMDVLIRTNIENEYQGRAWGIIGIISQFGYIVSYVSGGLLADYLFTPLLVKDGALSNSIGRIIGVGSGRGTALLIIMAGILLIGGAFVLGKLKDIKKLENVA